MTLARYKDLCIDAVDPGRLGAFWAAALGLALEDLGDGDVVLRGPTSQHTIWVNEVPEAKTVKHRMHLDVLGSSPTDLVGFAATVVDDGTFPWVVMTDPEGGEFCFFRRDDAPDYRLYELVVDAADHDAISSWWADVLGADRHRSERGFSYLDAIPGLPFEAICFVPVPEAKAIKNRIHIDVFADDLDALLDAGATLLRARDDEIEWDVLADPEGNEFCRFQPS